MNERAKKYFEERKKKVGKKEDKGDNLIATFSADLIEGTMRSVNVFTGTVIADHKQRLAEGMLF